MNIETKRFFQDQEPYETEQFFLDRVLTGDETEEIVDLIVKGHEHSAFEKFAGSPILDVVVNVITEEAK